MTITIGTDSGNKSVSEITVGTASGNKSVLEGWVGTSSGNKLFFVAATVSIANFSASTVEDFTGTAHQASYTLASDGSWTAAGSISGGSGYWIDPVSAAGSAFEARVTVVSGSVTGTTGSWLPLDTTRTWTLSRTAVGTSSTSLTVEIRRSGDGSVLDSANGSLSVQNLLS